MMPIESYATTDARIVHLALVGDISPADLDDLGRAGLARVAQGPVYVVVDTSQVTTMPRNLVNSALRSNALLNFANHPDARFFAFVKPGTALRMMIDQVFRNTPYKMLDDLDSAFALLEDEIIPNDHAP